MTNRYTPLAQEIRQQLEAVQSVSGDEKTEIAISMCDTSTAKAQCISLLAEVSMQYEEQGTVNLPEPPGLGAAVVYMTLEGPFEQRLRSINNMGRNIEVFGINILTPESVLETDSTDHPAQSVQIADRFDELQPALTEAYR